MSDPTLYDSDFDAWTTEQAGLLRAGRLSEVDLEHIAEEIESMGRSEKRELVSRMTILLLHLLKWQFQPVRQGPSWRLSIATSRDTLSDHLDENPSLRGTMDASIIVAYRRARRNAAVETGLAEATFPAACPWSVDELLAEILLPLETARVIIDPLSSSQYSLSELVAAITPENRHEELGSGQSQGRERL